MYEIWFSHGRRFVKCRKLNIRLKHTHTRRMLGNIQWSNGSAMCACLCEIEHVHSAVIKRISNNVPLSCLHSMQQHPVHSRCGRLHWVSVWYGLLVLLLLCWDICRHRASIAVSVVRCVHAKQNIHTRTHCCQTVGRRFISRSGTSSTCMRPTESSVGYSKTRRSNAFALNPFCPEYFRHEWKEEKNWIIDYMLHNPHVVVAYAACKCCYTCASAVCVCVGIFKIICSTLRRLQRQISSVPEWNFIHE